jgi:acyl-CoA thioesterase-1
VDGDQAFPAVVARQLATEGLPVRMVNAGVSGDTTADGVSRLDWILRQSPDVVVVGLGANDGLRGLDLAQTEANLRQILTRSRAAGADVLLLGMRMPPSHGPEYAERFRELFPRLTRELSVPLVPFLLEGVGGHPELNQGDGIHPDAEGQRLLAANVLPHLRPLVRERAERKR